MIGDTMLMDLPPEEESSRWWLWPLGIVAAFVVGCGIALTVIAAYRARWAPDGWQALGALGACAQAVAVLASFWFLSRQLKQAAVGRRVEHLRWRAEAMAAGWAPIQQMVMNEVGPAVTAFLDDLREDDWATGRDLSQDQWAGLLGRRAASCDQLAARMESRLGTAFDTAFAFAPEGTERTTVSKMVANLRRNADSLRGFDPDTDLKVGGPKRLESAHRSIDVGWGFTRFVLLSPAWVLREALEADA